MNKGGIQGQGRRIVELRELIETLLMVELGHIEMSFRCVPAQFELLQSLLELSVDRIG